MTNKQVHAALQDFHRAEIVKLFWIAASLSTSELEDALIEMDDIYIKNCFPEIYESQHFEKWRSNCELTEGLTHFDKYGFLAEVHIPHAFNFVYHEGEPSKWEVSSGMKRIDYVYAETTEDLIKEVEKVAESAFQDFMRKDKERQKP